MTRKRRSFSSEFKQEAASLVLDKGYTIPQASVSLGVGESAIRRWVNQLAEERDGVTPNDHGRACTCSKARSRTRRKLVNELNAHEVHADDLAKPLPDQPEPGNRLAESVKEFERPTAHAADSSGWDAWFDGEGVSADFMNDREEMESDR